MCAERAPADEATEARVNAPVKTRRYLRFEVSVHAAERYRERIDTRVNRPTATGILARILESGFVRMGRSDGADLYRDPRRPMRLEVVVVGRVVVTVFDPIEQTNERKREMVVALAVLERAHGHGGEGLAETLGPSERPCAPSSTATEGP